LGLDGTIYRRGERKGNMDKWGFRSERRGKFKGL
jgi:hypothetical protein